MSIKRLALVYILMLLCAGCCYLAVDQAERDFDKQSTDQYLAWCTERAASFVITYNGNPNWAVNACG